MRMENKASLPFHHQRVKIMLISPEHSPQKFSARGLDFMPRVGVEPTNPRELFYRQRALSTCIPWRRFGWLRARTLNSVPAAYSERQKCQHRSTAIRAGLAPTWALSVKLLAVWLRLTSRSVGYVRWTLPFRQSSRRICVCQVPPKGFEPSTDRLEGGCSVLTELRGEALFYVLLLYFWILPHYSGNIKGFLSEAPRLVLCGCV